jgi:hypothetical protein
MIALVTATSALAQAAQPQAIVDYDTFMQQDLEARTTALFSRDDMRQAMTINATYIPKK